MKINPVDNKFGKPKPYPVSFGIYKGTRVTSYGKCTYGKYRDYNIEVYDDVKDKAKLYYVSDNIRRWVKSKLVYLDNGIKRIIRSNSNGMQR